MIWSSQSPSAVPARRGSSSLTSKREKSSVPTGTPTYPAAVRVERVVGHTFVERGAKDVSVSLIPSDEVSAFVLGADDRQPLEVLKWSDGLEQMHVQLFVDRSADRRRVTDHSQNVREGRAGLALFRLVPRTTKNGTRQLEYLDHHVLCCLVLALWPSRPPFWLRQRERSLYLHRALDLEELKLRVVGEIPPSREALAFICAALYRQARRQSARIIPEVDRPRDRCAGKASAAGCGCRVPRRAHACHGRR